jgi:hypothetical protein
MAFIIQGDPPATPKAVEEEEEEEEEGPGPADTGP